jgi:peptidoglycan lytic transglycosylase
MCSCGESRIVRELACVDPYNIADGGLISPEFRSGTLLSLPAVPIQGPSNGNSRADAFRVNARSSALTFFGCSENVGHDSDFPEGEHMQMTAGHRTLSIIALGLLLLAAPVQASLEKIPPHAPVVRVTTLHKVSTVKTQMIASWYGQQFQGRKTASGEIFDLNKLTAAHKTLPLGSVVKLTVISTGKSIVVRINDRGPWIKGRDFDLSEEAATELGMHDRGIAAVEATVLKGRLARLALAQEALSLIPARPATLHAMPSE